MFLKESTAATLGGVALAAVSVQQVFDGTSFRMPGFTQAELLSFWLPTFGALLLLTPKVIPLAASQKKMLGAALLLFVGGRRLINGGFDLTMDNILSGHLPTIAGVALVAA